MFKAIKLGKSCSKSTEAKAENVELEAVGEVVPQLCSYLQKYRT